MPKFTNLNDLEKYLQKNIYDLLFKSGEIERIMAEEMSQAVLDVVYSSYEPESYERRGDDNGLSDVRNMQITNVIVEGNAIKMEFENLTKGNDNLKGEYTADLIEYGEGFQGKHWNNAHGAWAQPRPFAEETANRLRSNPTQLLNALKSELSRRGFDVR